MTIAEVEVSLPNGFHDALLHSYSVNLVQRTAELSMEISVGSPEATTPEERDAYRFAVLTLQEVEHFIVDPPDPRYACEAPWCVDLCDADATWAMRTSPGNFSARFYSAATNSFIHIAANSAMLRYE
jgi:hypothetical protein